MSTFTNNWNIELPDRGEYSGTWDSPVNANWVLIDQVLRNLHTNRISNDAPTTNIDDGSTWYDLALNLLKVRGNSGWYPVVSHTHNGTVEGVPKIRLSEEVEDDIAYALPGHLVGQAGNNADKLDGYHLSELPTAISDGATLEDDGGGKLRQAIIPAMQTLALVAAPTDTVELTKVTVDIFGRIVSGSKPNTISGFGITDVFSKTEIQSNFAAIRGITTSFFQVKDPVDGSSHASIPDITKCAISRSFADARYSLLSHNHPEYSTGTHNHDTQYHPKGGDVALGVDGQAPPSESTTYNNRFVPRLYADTRYKTPLTTHTGLPHIFATGGSMTGELILDRTTIPSSNAAAASKQWIISAFAALGGLATQTFLVAKAPTQGVSPGEWDKYALNYLRAVELFSGINHLHDGQYITGVDLSAALSGIESSIKASIDQSTAPETRQAIVSAKTDGSGNPDFFTYTGLNVNLLTASENLIVTMAARYTEETGQDANITKIFNTDQNTWLTLPSAAGTYKILAKMVSYDLHYNVSDEIVTSTSLTLTEISPSVPLSELPISGYLQVESGPVDGTVYEYLIEDVVGNPGVLTITPDLNIATVSSTIKIYTDAGATIPVSTAVLEPDAILGAVTYALEAPAGPTTGDYWYDISEHIFRVYSGAAWDYQIAIFLGEAVVAGSLITSITEYGFGTQVPTIFNAQPQGITFPAAPTIPYDIAGFIGGVPAATTLVFKFSSPRIFTPGTNHYGHCGTNPSAQTDFDVKVNGVSKSTIRVSIAGAVSFIDSGLNSIALAAGDRIEVISPAAANAIADVSFTFGGTV